MIRNMNTRLCYLVYFQSLLLVILFASTTTCITTDLAQNKADEVALRAFKSKIDLQGVLNSWNDSHHFCQWEGITCGRRHKRVTILDLSSRGMYGSLSPYIGNLSFLRELILSDNNIRGEIPREFGRLFRLTSLLLLNNSLVGKIPQEFVSLYNLKMLHVHKNKLEGNIPPFLGNLTSLESLSLSYNAFRGNIPDSLGRLRNLTYLALDGNNLFGQIPTFLESLRLQNLNLSFNDLEGEVPTKGIFMNASAISIFGNKLCGGIAELNLSRCLNSYSMKEQILPYSKKKKKKKEHLPPISKILESFTIGFFGMSVLLVSICLLKKAITNAYLRLIELLVSIFCLLKKRRERQDFGLVLRNAVLRVSYERLFKATNGFSSSYLIGVGSFGSLYKGFLDREGTIVVVKVLNLQRQGASKSFMAECNALKNIRHRNLLRVITSCSSIDFQGNNFKAIIYEFMENGSLEKWLHNLHPTILEIQSLTLVERITIAIDVASALDYLHHHCLEPIIHCDLKPSNVLLDSNMTACVGDFGLARFLPEFSFYNESSSFGVRGTIGYVAPEYGLGNKVSTNGDVYSYGILLLEMVTRKKPTDPMFKGGLNLHNYARMALPDRVMEIVDPILLINEMAVPGSNQRMSQTTNMMKKECLLSMVSIGVACSMESPQDRMNISHVVRELQLVRDILLQPAAGFNIQRGQKISTYPCYFYEKGNLLRESRPTEGQQQQQKEPKASRANSKTANKHHKTPNRQQNKKNKGPETPKHHSNPQNPPYNSTPS